MRGQRSRKPIGFRLWVVHNRNSDQELINSKSYRFDQVLKLTECDEDTHNVFVTYSNNRGKFLRHEEYTINLFGKKATALVVGSILAGVLVIAPEIGIPLGAKLVLGATSAGLIGHLGLCHGIFEQV